MSIKLSEIGRHEAWLRLSAILKAGDPQKQLERKLTSELLKNWRETYENVLKELFKRLPKDLSPQAIELITQRLSDTLGQSFGSSPKVRDELKKYITRAYENGKNEFALKPNLSLPDLRVIDVLTKHNCYWLGEHYDKHIKSKIAELAQDALNNGLGRDELADELRESLGGKVGGYKYWDVAASAALVRSRSFGCISGMVEAGIAEYEILAMNDERTCPICGELDGTVHQVSIAQARIDSALSIDDPERFKEAFSWPPSPNEETPLPPFHGRCRCILSMSEVTDITAESFPGVKAEDVLSYDEKMRTAQISVHSMPRVGLSGWSYDKFVSKNGVFSQRRYYDAKGNPKLDIDFDDHGSSKAHPMGAHAHDYVKGQRGLPRLLKEWERAIMEELSEQGKKDIEKSAHISNGIEELTDEHVTIEEYKAIMKWGGEYSFVYDGHGYFTSDFGKPTACEWEKETSFKEGFKNIDEMLDSYRVHTGETLREIIPKSTLYYSPISPQEAIEDLSEKSNNKTLE